MIVIKRKHQIIAECPSNTAINHKLLFEWEESMVLRSKYIPRVGEYINYNGERMRVTEVEYSASSNDDYLDDVKLYVSPMQYPCNYYDYFKAFSHTYDYMKSKTDPTRVENCMDYTTALPETAEEWLRDLEDLKNRVRDPERRSVKRK